MEPIKNRIIKNELVDIDRLTPFQGQLKTLDDIRFNKLRKSLIEEGFSFTVHVWENAEVIYIIDGHQRVSVLTQMRKQGFEVPLINCAFVSARTYKEAKKLVLLAISQYGKIQKQGMKDFIGDDEFDYDDFDFPDLDFSLDELSFDPDPPEETDQDDDENLPSEPEDEEPQDPIDDLPERAPERVSLGQVWQLGRHVLACGDSGNTSLVHSVIGQDEADCVVSDPPYGLSFMGKEWDKGVPSQHLWEVWYSRLKPGAHLLSFSGTRTYHLMTVAIEKAGFEVRDMMQWIYGQGFPKSQDISKAIDKSAGAEREVVGYRKESGPDFSDEQFTSQGSMMQTHQKAPRTQIPITAAATPDAQKWSGWGTALKPANEPICVARKPCSEKTVAANVLKWGTGGLNIDGTRISTEGQDMGDLSRFDSARSQGGFYTVKECKKLLSQGIKVGEQGQDLEALLIRLTDDRFDPSKSMAKTLELGRFPSNVLFDQDAAEVLDEQSGVLKSGAMNGVYKNTIMKGKPGERDGKPVNLKQAASEGGASRFFYVAKPSKSEKGKENHHATVKPVSLMQYLVRMVCQPDGLVLEPFAGSGTTLLACEKEGMNCIGFELDPKHCDIILSRWEKLTGDKATLVTVGE